VTYHEPAGNVRLPTAFWETLEAAALAAPGRAGRAVRERQET
jgi:hypothetical protein